MKECICTNCGYRRIERGVVDYVLEPPVFPLGMANTIFPFLAMDYIWEEQMACPNCKKTDCWSIIS